MAVAGAAVGLGVLTKKKHENLGACVADCDSLGDEGKRLQLLTNLSVGVAVALAAGAIVAIAVKPRNQDAVASLTLGPGGLGYRLAY